LRLAVLVLNWRNLDSTYKTIDSILASGSTFAEDIYIVDNASNDGSFEALSERYPNCNTFCNTQNSGYTGGNNYGLKKTYENGYDATLILNNDIEFHSTDNFKARCKDIISLYPFSLIGLCVVEPSTSRVSYPTKPGLTLRLLLQRTLKRTDDYRDFPILCGCAMIISRRAFEEIGGLDESLFMYCEELEYSIRIENCGGHVLALSEEVAQIHREEDKAGRSRYVFYYQTRNLLRVLQKYSNEESKIFYLMIASLLILAAARTRSIPKIRAAILGLKDAIAGVSGYKSELHS